MKYFAASLEKIAQLEAPKPISPAQLYAAKRAEKDLENLMKSDSSKAYATSITGGILKGMAIPTIFGLRNLTPAAIVNKTGKVRDTIYLTEALRSNLINMSSKDARLVSAALVASPESKIGVATQNNIISARFKLAELAAKVPDGGDIFTADMRKNILKPFMSEPGALSSVERAHILHHPESTAARTKRFYLNLDPIPGTANKFYKDFPLAERIREAAQQGRLAPEFRAFNPNTFSSDETEALLNLGKYLYKQRTGKEVSDLGTALKIVSQTVGKSIKFGLPIGVVGGIYALKSQRAKAKEKRDLFGGPNSVSPRVFGGVE